ncbi:hypothetical protein BKA64DRAFT_735662, partial [Cadophora sp. MPI-SDFR-AT-0126]
MHFPGVAVVVGAGSGIGRATAKMFVTETCKRIFIGDVNPAGLEETKKIMKELDSGVDVQSGVIDVALEDSVKKFFENAVKAFGRIDYACNIAGILITGDSPDFSMESFDKQYHVNARGMWLCQRAELTYMLKQDPIKALDSHFEARGAIVNVSSMAGLRGYDSLPSYCASKYAVIGFTKADALKYAANLIRINAVCPGVIKTPMLGDETPEMVKERTKDMAVARQGLPEEIAEGLLWAVSGRSSLMTATTLVLNGGMAGA